MSTLSFAFGMLAMFAVALVIAIVVGIVKVYKLETKFNKHDLEAAETRQQAHRIVDELRREIYLEHERMMRAVNDQITDSVTQCNSYTDKRVDQSKNKNILKG